MPSSASREIAVAAEAVVKGAVEVVAGGLVLVFVRGVVGVVTELVVMGHEL